MTSSDQQQQATQPKSLSHAQDNTQTSINTTNHKRSTIPHQSNINQSIPNVTLVRNLFAEQFDAEFQNKYTHANFRKQVHFGCALAKEDGFTGLPQPLPIDDKLSNLLDNFNNSSEHFNKDVDDERSIHDKNFYPSTNKSQIDSKTISSIKSKCNRYSFAIIMPGGGIKKESLSSNQYDSIRMFTVVNDSHIVIDLYSPDQADKAHTKILLRQGDCLIVQDDKLYDWQIGVQKKTRDVFEVNTNGHTEKHNLKRSQCLVLTISQIKPTYQDSVRPNQDENCDDKQKAPKAIPIYENSTCVLGSEMETSLVHNLYDSIALHFSSTRHSPWPRVEKFVREIPAQSHVLDIACGNGKYMALNRNINIQGIDISSEFVKICQQKGFKVQQADSLALPFDNQLFDYCISIALMHHISTPERRLKCLSEALRMLKPNGQLLITAWAQEQDLLSKRRFQTQDVLVPWNLPQRFQHNKKTHQKHIQEQSQYVDELLTADEKTNKPKTNTSDPDPVIQFQRYCHVYVKDELENLFAQVGNNRIVESYYDRGNWCCVVEKI